MTIIFLSMTNSIRPSTRCSLRLTRSCRCGKPVLANWCNWRRSCVTCPAIISRSVCNLSWNGKQRDELFRANRRERGRVFVQQALLCQCSTQLVWQKLGRISSAADQFRIVGRAAWGHSFSGWRRISDGQELRPSDRSAAGRDGKTRTVHCAGGFTSQQWRRKWRSSGAPARQPGSGPARSAGTVDPADHPAQQLASASGGGNNSNRATGPRLAKDARNWRSAICSCSAFERSWRGRRHRRQSWRRRWR